MTRETQAALASLQRTTGKRYPKLEAAFEHLDVESQRELLRLTQDIDHAVRQAEGKGALQPWRVR